MTTTAERVAGLYELAEEHDKWGRRDEAASARAAAAEIEQEIFKRRLSWLCMYGDCAVCASPRCDHRCHQGTNP